MNPVSNTTSHTTHRTLPLDFRAMAAVSNLFRASAAIRRHMEAKILADDRLSWTSFVALWVLWVWGEMESRDLAAAVGISRPTSTGIVTTLEGRGFVRRSKTAEDGRLVRVSLTTTGRRTIEQLFPRFNAEEVVLTTHLEPVEDPVSWDDVGLERAAAPEPGSR